MHYYSSTNIHFSTTPSTKKKKKITVFDNLVEQNQTTLLSLSNQPANKLISELLMAIFWLLEKKKIKEYYCAIKKNKEDIKKYRNKFIL